VLALGMGLLAALAWGVHDLCVRTVSRRADIPACLAGVFTVGLVLMLPFGVWRAIVADPGGTVTIAERSMSLWSGLGVGVLFALANYALYRAFAAGPVRLVAPITAAYPVVTVGLAALAGQSVSVASWLAIAVVIVGIALVASGTPAGEAAFSRRVVIGRRHGSGTSVRARLRGVPTGRAERHAGRSGAQPARRDRRPSVTRMA